MLRRWAVRSDGVRSLDCLPLAPYIKSRGLRHRQRRAAATIVVDCDRQTGLKVMVMMTVITLLPGPSPQSNARP